jgi:hypothetical protein
MTADIPKTDSRTRQTILQEMKKTVDGLLNKLEDLDKNVAVFSVSLVLDEQGLDGDKFKILACSGSHHLYQAYITALNTDPAFNGVSEVSLKTAIKAHSNAVKSELRDLKLAKQAVSQLCFHSERHMFYAISQVPKDAWIQQLQHFATSATTNPTSITFHIFSLLDCCKGCSTMILTEFECCRFFKLVGSLAPLQHAIIEVFKDRAKNVYVNFVVSSLKPLTVNGEKHERRAKHGNDDNAHQEIPMNYTRFNPSYFQINPTL